MCDVRRGFAGLRPSMRTRGADALLNRYPPLRCCSEVEEPGLRSVPAAVSICNGHHRVPSIPMLT